MNKEILTEGDVMYLKAFEQQTMPLTYLLGQSDQNCWPSNESNQLHENHL